MTRKIAIVALCALGLVQRTFSHTSPTTFYYYFKPSAEAAAHSSVYYPQQQQYGCHSRCYPPSQAPTAPALPVTTNHYRWIYRPAGGAGRGPFPASSSSYNVLPYIQPGRPPAVGNMNNVTSSITSSIPYLPSERIIPQVPLTSNTFSTTTTATIMVKSTIATINKKTTADVDMRSIAIVIYPDSRRSSYNSQTTVTYRTPFPTVIPYNYNKRKGAYAVVENSTPQSMLTSTLTPCEKVEQNAPVSRSQNPCSNGKPLTARESKAPVTCNFVLQPNGGCPDGFWCHTGPSYETTTCCPNFNSKERCNLPKTSGEGEDLIPRWYYDINARKCKRFLYKGVKGNANNFITNIQCMESCETADRAAAYKNPCGSGPPARNLDGALFVCGPFANNGRSDIFAADENSNDERNSFLDVKCPAGYFCHVGESVETTACCEHSSVRDACLLPLNEGEGTAQLRRFYYNIDLRRCTEFTYRGIRGNENNFLSAKECRRTCGKFNDPCPTPFNSDVERKSCASVSGGAEACAENEWCHVGNGDNADTTVCCPGAVADPCKLPLNIGQGDSNLTRWYSDDSEDSASDGASCRRCCRPFTYGGSKGNQNNFISREQCEAVCKHCVNPCSSGALLIDAFSGRPQFCNDSMPCPTDHWCHNGATVATSVCCTAVKRPCGLPLAEGNGHAVLSRWYYSKEEGTCKRFTYRGIGGNQNNYISRDECLAACPTDDFGNIVEPAYSTVTTVVNPCGGGTHPLMVGDHAKICNPSHRCPSTHFCHIGADETLNLCCPKNGDPCEHPVSVGQGSSTIKRFYFDSKMRSCREFTYRGMKGNANNFLSQSDCELVCQAGILHNPCANGTPLTDDASGETIVCGGDERCPAGYFCHVGGSPETTNCCPMTTKRTPCELPLVVGEGREKLERWYFEVETQNCLRFDYAGLKGNANNFLTETACREQCPGENPCLVGRPLTITDKYGTTSVLASCRGDEPMTSCGTHTHFCHVGSPESGSVCCTRSALDACDLPVNNGVGDAALKRWYYNAARSKCESFRYGGARGNENNFLTRDACKKQCPSYRYYCPHGSPLLDENDNSLVTCGIDKSCPRDYVCHMNAQFNIAVCCEDPTNFCLHARDPGPCEGSEKRYGYNSLTDSCVEYNYGGCGGTLNNFATKERCTEICCREYQKRKFMFDTPRENRLNNSNSTRTQSYISAPAINSSAMTNITITKGQL